MDKDTADYADYYLLIWGYSSELSYEDKCALDNTAYNMTRQG